MTRILTATPSMVDAHCARQPLGPTPERAAKAEIRRPALDQASRRDAHEIVTVLDRCTPHLKQEQIDLLMGYAQTVAAQETASLAGNAYSPRVDQGGWRADRDEDNPVDDRRLADASADLARMRRILGNDARRLFDALIDAINNPRHPCPFEGVVTRAFILQFPRAKVGGVNIVGADRQTLTLLALKLLLAEIQLAMF